jgi:hypothetical protein
MAQKETHILIATGGSLNDEIRVEMIVIDESNMEEDEFDDFGEYADPAIDEAKQTYIAEVKAFGDITDKISAIANKA